MKKSLALSIIMVLGIFAIAGWSLFVIRGNALTQELATMQATATSLSTELRATKADNTELKDSLSEATDLMASANEELSSSKERIELIASELTDIKGELREAESHVSELESIAVCQNKPARINYSSNSSVSNSIKTWLENTEGTVEKVEWDVVWNNSKVSTHRLWGKYLWVYLVYFDDEDMNRQNAVYDFTQKCFLDY